MKSASLLLGSLALALAGCGGSPAPAAAPNLQLQDMQGFWSGAVSGTSLQSAASTQAVVLPGGTAWFLLVPASGAPTGMVKATLAVSGISYSGSGKVYEFSTGNAAPITLSGSAVAASQLTTDINVTGAAGLTSASLTYSNAYTTPVTLANVSGTWQVSASSGALHVAWTVQPDGTLSGTSTTGCTWTGGFTTSSGGGTAVLNFAATEACTGTSIVYSGIAVLDSTRTRATLFVTTPSDAQGFVLSMTMAMSSLPEEPARSI